MAASWRRPPVIAVVTGVLSGGLAMALIEWLGHEWLGTADVAKPETISTPMLAWVPAAWALVLMLAAAWLGARSPIVRHRRRRRPRR